MQTEPEHASFADLDLPEALLRAIKQLGYESPSPIQGKSIPVLLEGKNIIGQAQTGTGKTAAFALPILANIDLKQTAPQALVLAPTRELAIQVAEAFQVYARHMKNFHVLPIYGGADMRGQLRALKRGAHVVVGTPGRILDHLGRKSLKLNELKTVVLDEADEMLRMGFIDDVDTILAETPETRQTAMFSATMPDRIRQIAKRHVESPVHIKIKAKTAVVDTIEQAFLIINQGEKLDALTRYLDTEATEGVIIFVRTREATVTVAEKLNARGYIAAAINGDISQPIREKTIARLKKSQLDILVATDVAARGIDVERISHVINFDIPYDSEAYVHRIGRTGRAGRSGKALLFVQPRERRLLGIIEKDTKQKLNSWEKPSAKQMAEQRKTKLAEVLAAKLETNLPSVYHQWVEELCQQLELPAEQLAAALLSEQFTLEQLLPPPETKKPRREKNLRDGRGDRNERGSRTERGERKPRKPRREDNIALEKYRIEAGHNHGVQPKDIVGALANEAGIDREYIGRIELNDDHSLVGLPPGMPKDIFQLLQKVRVKGQPMRLSRTQASNSDEPEPTEQAASPSTRKKTDAKTRSRKPKATEKDRPRRNKPAPKKKPQS
ncbi:MAG: DEAD/DEAH box helicase [Pseudomonadales bacterium]|nr:DEAD/DEAH box helicase [Pseudomonadales bacterium]